MTKGARSQSKRTVWNSKIVFTFQQRSNHAFITQTVRRLLFYLYILESCIPGHTLHLHGSSCAPVVT